MIERESLIIKCFSCEQPIPFLQWVTSCRLKSLEVDFLYLISWPELWSWRLHFSVPCEFTEPCPLSHQPVCKQTILWCLHLIAPTPAHTTAGVRHQCYPKRPGRWCPIHLCRYCLVSCMACGKYLLRGNTVNKSWAWSQADLGSNPSSPFC